MKNTRSIFKLPCLPHVEFRNLETYKQANKSIREEMYRYQTLTHPYTTSKEKKKIFVRYCFKTTKK